MKTRVLALSRAYHGRLVLVTLVLLSTVLAAAVSSQSWAFPTALVGAAALVFMRRRFDWSGEVKPALQGKIEDLRLGFGRMVAGE